ncbi:MAG: type IV pilus twitching motility protein PilT [Actinobacteria bacterium]|nr:type IV pilus twitching motility protein PilT [Actinomycetota bacterium]
MNLNELLLQVLNKNASDLHITTEVPPIIRVNGDLIALNYPALKPNDTKELICSILNREQRECLEKNLEYDFSYSLDDKARFRVNAYFQKGNLSAALRLIPIEIRTIYELGLPKALEELTKKPRGFVLVTGPTGCGKSTTLSALINIINETRSDHIITIEDPIEYIHKHKKCVINQREVGMDTKSFSTALKYVLRQDPDVILIGEMRDLDTISAALTAAETGHLVFSTLHTQDAPQTIDRIIDVFPPHQQGQVRIQLASSLQGIIAQQLLQTKDGLGRVVATEVLIPTPAVRNLIREGKTHQIYTAMQTGTQFGMQTMDQSLADLYRRGKITFNTAISRAVDQQDLKRILVEV